MSYRVISLLQDVYWLHFLKNWKMDNVYLIIWPILGKFVKRWELASYYIIDYYILLAIYYSMLSHLTLPYLSFLSLSYFTARSKHCQITKHISLYPTTRSMHLRTTIQGLRRTTLPPRTSNARRNPNQKGVCHSVGECSQPRITWR